MKIVALLLSIFVMNKAYGYEKAFKATEPGQVELKTLPAGRLLASRGSDSYFQNSNQLFGPLFRYISDRGIAMTTPVEAHMDPGTMYFWVASDQLDLAEDDTDSVVVIDVPERRVAAVGARGAYSEANFNQAKDVLLDWIEGQDSIAITGEPYAVYWNGPFTPWFMKTFEVQVVVTPFSEQDSK